MADDKYSFDRSDRVSQQLHREIARLFLSEINDPRLEEIQIVDVESTPDLRVARVYYTMMHGEEPGEQVQPALEGVTGFVKNQLASVLELRYIPEVEFVFDESVLKARRIDELLSGLDDHEVDNGSQ